MAAKKARASERDGTIKAPGEPRPGGLTGFGALS